MAERDARREHVGHRPHRHPVPPQIQQRDGDGGDQAAVEHAGRAEQVQQLAASSSRTCRARRRASMQLGADERADDDPDAEVHDPVRVEAARPRAHQRELQPEQVRGGQQQRRRCRRGSRRSQTGWDAWRASEADHIEQDEDRADRDGGVGNVERPEVRRAPVDVDEVDDVPDDGAIDQVAERAAEDERQPERARAARESRAASRRRRSRRAPCRQCAIMTAGLVREVGGVQQPERRAGVLHVREIEKARDDAALARRGAAACGGRSPCVS